MAEEQAQGGGDGIGVKESGGGVKLQTVGRSADPDAHAQPMRVARGM